MRRRRKVVIASAAVVALVAAAVVWKIATRKDDPCPGYDVVYDGYGHVSCEEGTVKIQPRSAARKQDTHAGLVVAGGQSSAGKVGASMQTTDQVRDGQPNPWEVGWFLWRYQDPQHFYAVVLKPNGWEVSKQDPSYKGGQRFLKSNDAKDPRKFPPHNTAADKVNPYSVLIKACHEYPLGTTPTDLQNDIVPANRNSEAGNKARLTPSKNIFHIFVESQLLATVTDTERPLPPHIPAFYAEDARVRFTSMWHATPKRPQLRPSPADYDPLSLHATGYPPQGVVWF